MHKQTVAPFKYHVGISSLAQIATREDRVCVLNILGGKSSDVTPVSHAYSGGNVVFGTSAGRSGQVLETTRGSIPVYNNVREGLDAGHRFNCGVVYLPPSGARDGVAELIRVNPELEKIFIVTEKLSVHELARDPRHGSAARDRHLRRQQPRRRRCMERGADRRRARRRPTGGGAAEGLDRDLLKLRQLHHDHRHLSAHGGLGNDHADLERQGPLHSLRRARIRLRPCQ